MLIYTHDVTAGEKHIRAKEIVADLGQWLTHSPTARDVIEAIQLHRRAKLSFWGAMLVTSAHKLNCSLLWSEDLRRGQVIAGVTVRDPFAAS